MAPSTLKLKYDTAAGKLQTTLGVWVDDVKVKLALTEKTLKDVNTVKDDIDIGIEKPGHFMVEHHLHKQYTRFQFHSSAEVKSKVIKLTLVHHIGGPGITTLDAASAINSSSKVTVKHNFSKPGPVVKFEYNQGLNAIEPQFDFGDGDNDAWGVSLKHGHGKKEFVKATYMNKKKLIDLELHKKIDGAGPLKISAVLDVNDLKKVPKILLEKEWNI